MAALTHSYLNTMHL